MPSLKLPIYGQQTRADGLEARRWRTLGEHEAGGGGEPGEFPEGAAETPEGLSRRSFLQLLGASVALAGVEGCKPPREKVVSYVRQPADVTPSVPSAYATAVSRRGYAVGLVVTSWEGRPTKIEGNPAHPASRGGTDAILQASILDLYDPARLRGFTRQGRPLGRPALAAELSRLAKDHDRDGGARLRFLLEPTSSPTLADLRRRVQVRFPRSRLDVWEPAGEEAARAGATLAFGAPLEAVLDLTRADVILSLESDLLAREGDALRQAREFAGRREPGSMNRLYVAEAAFTVTGGMADHRFRMRSAEVAAFARGVCAELAARHGLGKLAPLGARLGGARTKAVAAVAADLARAKGRALVVAGLRQPAAVHALAAAMNEALGAAGTTVAYRAPGVQDSAPEGGIGALARELAEGRVDAVVVTAWNPLYAAPADLELGKHFGRAKDSIVLALREDETVRAASWRLAASHPLESWGDLSARDGSVSIVQPLVSPLHESTGEIELLAALLDEGQQSAWRVVRDGWRARAGALPVPLPASGRLASSNPPSPNRIAPPDPFDARWEGWLAAGVREGAAAKESPGVDAARIAAALLTLPVPGPGLELGFLPDYKVDDGRHLENAWLQELPDPVTKLTWDNAAQLSPATARRLGLADGDLVELSYRGRQLIAPALAVPGHADEAVTLALGYGQGGAGAVGNGTGVNAYALRTADALWFGGGLELRRAPGRVELAITQGHFSMEGRAIALALDAGALDERETKEKLDLHRGEPVTILSPVDYTKVEYRWGMAIDLTRCIGCGACTIACQAENNIPVVGKEQVILSREMHWLRVDRYFEGSPDEPQSVSQPLACVHCEMAPCEYVCPVNATVHSEEGLNEMVYNRCVGTRYCSNNCPYKVRRFNWLDWHGEMAPSLKLLQNPDVTVRARGVMEKCTYCTQRIERARIGARSEGRKLGGDEVVSACQQACPTEAIVFGNLNDPGSRVSKRHHDARVYDLLHELGTRPRTTYLVKLRNPNPDLA